MGRDHPAAWTLRLGRRPRPGARRTGVLLAVAGLLLGLTTSLPVGWAPREAEAQQRYELEDAPGAADDEARWRAVDAPRPGSPEAKIAAIRRLLAAGDGEKAEQRATRWIRDHPRHPRLPEVYLLRGDAKAEQKQFYKALFDYEIVARRFPATEQFTEALEREFVIADRFAQGLRRKLLWMRIVDAGGEAEELFIRIQERAPGSELGEKASLALADYYYRDLQMQRAAVAYELFLLNYPDSIHREHAMRRLVEANIATFKGPRFDATGLVEAGQRLEQFEAAFPAAAQRFGADALKLDVRESLARKGLAQARWYENRGERVSAAYVLQRIVADYPATAAAQEAARRLEQIPGRFRAPRRPAEARDADRAAPPAEAPAPLLRAPGGGDAADPVEVEP